ncbi:hypothetical protein SUNI508_13926 [Seiridium unicorne]|uniref:Uncharacterized protein n=1 Tax=Seiridium unicorne TaxID=138068 RepID=A0ABR2VA61_9PEZI
MIFIFDGI